MHLHKALKRKTGREEDSALHLRTQESAGQDDTLRIGTQYHQGKEGTKDHQGPTDIMTAVVEADLHDIEGADRLHVTVIRDLVHQDKGRRDHDPHQGGTDKIKGQSTTDEILEVTAHIRIAGIINRGDEQDSCTF
jgi:hypothetical protein